MRETGWYWPDRVERPGGFLAHRLRRVSERLDALTQASTGGGCAAAAAGSMEEGTGGQQPADPAVRAAAMDAIRTVLRSRTAARTEFVVSEDVCEMCGTAIEQRPSERHARLLCAACSAVMDRDATEVSGVPVLA